MTSRGRPGRDPAAPGPGDDRPRPPTLAYLACATGLMTVCVWPAGWLFRLDVLAGFVAVPLCVVVHEYGHARTALFLGARELRAEWRGGSMAVSHEDLGPVRNLSVALGGPAASGAVGGGLVAVGLTYGWQPLVILGAVVAFPAGTLIPRPRRRDVPAPGAPLVGRPKGSDVRSTSSAAVGRSAGSFERHFCTSSASAGRPRPGPRSRVRRGPPGGAGRGRNRRRTGAARSPRTAGGCRGRRRRRRRSGPGSRRPVRGPCRRGCR